MGTRRRLRDLRSSVSGYIWQILRPLTSRGCFANILCRKRPESAIKKIYSGTGT